MITNQMCFDFFFLIRIDQLPVILQNTFTDFKVLMSTFNSTFLRQIILHNLFFRLLSIIIDPWLARPVRVFSLCGTLQ